MIIYIFSKRSCFEKFYCGSRKNKNNVRLRDKFRNHRSNQWNEKIEIAVWFLIGNVTFLYLYPVPSYFADKFNVSRAPFNVSH